MKKITYFIMIALSIFVSSCMDRGYDDVDTSKSPYGNNDIVEDPAKVKTIAELKTLFPTTTQTTSGCELINQDLQVKGYVTANDVEGSFYNEIVIQDDLNSENATGALCIEITNGGLFASIPEGAEIIVNLKGLYIGNYRGQIQIGTSYTNTEKQETYPSRMLNAVWQKHYKLLSKGNTIIPKVYADGSTGTCNFDFAKDGGKYGIFKNVSLSYYFDIATLEDVKNINENTTYASGTNGSAVSWYFNENINSSKEYAEFYCSAYSDFAANKIPYDTELKKTKKMNITGIVKCYNNIKGTSKKMEIIVRKFSDIEVQQ